MRVHRSRADVQLLCDLPVAPALGEGLEHFAFPGGQLVDGELRLAIALSHEEPQGPDDLQLGEQLLVAGGQAAHRFHEIAHGRRLVHDPCRARLYRFGQVSLLRHGAQDERLGVRMKTA